MEYYDRRRLLAAAAAAGGLLWTRGVLAQAAAPAAAQWFPIRPIKLVVPSSAGGGTGHFDSTARR